MKKYLLVIFLLTLLIGCRDASSNLLLLSTERSPTKTSTSEATSPVETTPLVELTSTAEPERPILDRPRIILFIGDGMGSEHRIAGQYYSVGEDRQLMMDALPVSGWLHTDPYDGQLPESASAATSLATGQKTYTGVISLDINGDQLKTILEYAQDLDMSVGLVSTRFITDATTAAFGAHVESNSMGTEVALQFLEHRVDVIFGGGENDFLPSGVEGCHPEMGKRNDGRNLIQEAQEDGYRFICDAQSFFELDQKLDSPVLGLFADKSMTRPYSPTLAEMTEAAIEILSLNPNGFFLVVEGAMIDIASHFHQSQNVLNDIVDLDEAVGVGIEYADLDENMLIIVTADHETGGLSVDLYSNGSFNEDGPFYMPMGTKFYLRWSTGGHTSADVPVTAFGEGSEKLDGINDNTLVFDVMLDFLGIR